MSGVPAGWLFNDFVARWLIRALPFRRQGFFRASTVCEYGAVRPMDKSAFFIGAGLSLANKDAAEIVLANLSGFGNYVWQFDFGRKPYVERAVEQALRPDVSFDDVHSPEIRFIDTGAVWDMAERQRRGGDSVTLPDGEALSPDQCVRVLQGWVGGGVWFGLVIPRTTETMLRNWISQPSSTRRLGVGGLSVGEKPKLTSVEQALAVALEVFTAWTMENPDADQFARESLAKHLSEESFVSQRQEVLTRYAGF